MTLVDLHDAQPETSGGKAAGLGTLLRAGVEVPTGVVIPVGEYRRHLARHGLDPARTPLAELRERILQMGIADGLVRAIDDALRHRLPGDGAGYMAVRSSATYEDLAGASAAGQYDSVLAVRGTDAVCAAVLRCWASLWSVHALAYRGERSAAADATPEMAVLIQPFLDAEVSGVLFTGQERILEATYGLGERLVSGAVTPDSWRITSEGILARRVGSTTHRADRVGERIQLREVPADRRRAMCLSDAQVRGLDGVGQQVARVLGASADIEWALTGEAIHVLQARPVTTTMPSSLGPLGPLGPLDPRDVVPGPGSFHGVPASGGTATGTVRLIDGPDDFPRVGTGDVLVCRSTDPAWTPLFRIAGAVVTETGGVLSHAAILARELGIPAVLAVPGALQRIPDGATVTVDGDDGTIQVRRPG
ncbi:PEP/pyruvate-binding domain-containing protein [Brachybacterium sp. FME24]|uniref:PEP/pyruvate-binding domain-containing protein n=1 Tax=Brachybacterium sp. FME24 TaxID=2742605 RepID=UPI001867E04C|nr:PEP/pyruvate-binding domain-containing protein [Brachybacterium sp. FME24]